MTDEQPIEQTLELVRRELRRHGSLVLEESNAVLTTLMPGQLEGHFRVDPRRDGSWRIWGRYPEQELLISGPVSANALALVAAETLLEMRRRYCIEFGHPVPPPLPPPYVRIRRKADLALEIMVAALGGKRAGGGTHGHDVLAQDGRRVRVEASTRSPKSGLMPRLRFKSESSYYGHDEFVYIVFSAHNWPTEAWSIASDWLRARVPYDGERHQVEPILVQLGTDIGQPVLDAFESLYVSFRVRTKT